MARITVTDCLEHVENRFQLVLIASKRARQLAMGAKAMVAEDNDKPTVIALREIAEQHVDATILEADNTGFFNEDEEIQEVSDEMTDEEIIAMIEGDLSAPVDKAPAIADKAPTIAEEAPTIAEEAPTIAEEAPTIAEDAPTIAEEAPAIAEEAPAIAEEVPTIAEEALTIAEQTSTITEDAPVATVTLEGDAESKPLG